jgi:hypothetical protein
MGRSRGDLLYAQTGAVCNRFLQYAGQRPDQKANIHSMQVAVTPLQILSVCGYYLSICCARDRQQFIRREPRRIVADLSVEALCFGALPLHGHLMRLP